MLRPLRVLLVEDRPTDAELVVRELRRAGFDPNWSQVDTEEEYLSQLSPDVDLILSDYTMPNFSGLRALELVNQSGLDLPFIIVSGSIGEDIAVSAMKQGATDYLLKDRLERLGPATTMALEQKQLRDEKTRADAAFEQLQRQHELILQSVGDGIHGMDLNGNIVFENPAGARMLGWEIDELVGKPAHETIHHSHPDGSDFPKEQCSIYATFCDGITRNVTDEVFWRKDGSHFPVEYLAAPMRSHLGSIIGTVVTFRDITERSRAEARIREQADLLDHAHDAIIVRDTYTRKISFWNHGAESVYGWTAAEAVGCDIGKLIFTDPGALDAVTAQLLKTGEWRGEHHHVSKAGKELNISGRVTLLRDASGNPKSALVINTDITEQKKLEQQFLRAQRMESIGTLASGVAHDLNNILSPIMMSVSMLRDELPLDLRDRIISTIEKSAQRGADIVKQVVSFARGVEGERMLVQPIHLIKEVAEFAQQMFPKSIVVRPRYSDRIWVVEGDPTQLHQVLLNLCVNARDAMPNGGKLTIALENFTVDEQYAGMMPGSQPGPYVIITVSDTGVGIPSELIDKIFDPFFTTKELGKGTGLGLSTVVGIVKNHGGFVTVDSVEGRGTTFKVFLPANSSAVTTGPATEAMPLPPGHGEMVLVVDDEQSILLITQTMLEKHGYRVVTAADGTGALTLFAQQMNEIDVVLTDVSMPFMDGTGLARVLKRMSPLTPMIACSGQREEAHEAELKDLGVKVFLRKPYNTVELLTALRSVLDNHAGDQK